jgi:uncharacterized membrane protein
METNPPSSPGPQADAAPPVLRRAWHGIRGRILGGLLLVLPVLITFWVVYWLYSVLEDYAIRPLARLVIWKARVGQPETEPPFWFETYAAPLIGILIAVVLLYCLGFFVRSRLRRAMDWMLLRVPVISLVYNGVRQVFQAVDRQRGEQRLQRAVLVAFPHPGMKAPAFVTATCRDVSTGKVLLCVFVPTAPMPASGFIMLVPEEEVTELNWSPEQTLQVLISVGLTAPAEVPYFRTGPASDRGLVAVRAAGEVPRIRPDERQPPTA